MPLILVSLRRYTPVQLLPTTEWAVMRDNEYLVGRSMTEFEARVIAEILNDEAPPEYLLIP
jgi:hypothetical protein